MSTSLGDSILKLIENNGNGDTPVVEHEPSTWTPIDLTDAVNGGDIPEPSLLARIDGIKLLYTGRTHWFQGEPESCKTWMAGAAVAAVIQDGGHVLWIDFEDDENTAVARLKALGLTAGQILSHFAYIRPEEPLSDRQGRATKGQIDFTAALQHDYQLIVIDGVTEGMVTEGLDLMDNADIARWLRLLPKRLADTGAAVVALDHLTKNRESQGRYAIGGQHKLAGITGAAYSFEVVKPFARAVGTEPGNGSVIVKVVKDRSGYIRARALDGRIAILDLTSYPDGGVNIQLLPPDSNPAPDMTLCAELLRYLAQYEGASQTQIEKGIPGKADRIRTALRWMADEERSWVVIDKHGQSYRHTLTASGRTHLD
jgi:hypothetical protein